MSAIDATEITLMTKVTQHLLALHQQRSTGTLEISLTKSPFSKWRLYFYLGRLVYATGGVHPVRRWHRAVRIHCPELLLSGWLMQVQPESELWEVDVLNQAIQQQQIKASQARNVVENIVREVIFAFIEQKSFTVEWQPSTVVAKRTAFLAVEPVVQAAYQLRKDWCEAGLGHLQSLLSQFSPDLAPIVRNPTLLQAQVTPLLYRNLMQIMQGKRTLWDVALKMQRPLPAVTRSLLPLMRQGIIELVDIPDLPHPYPHPDHAKPACRGKVACIDDSPVVTQAIAQILTPLGYEVIPIDNPLQGIATLWAAKPDVIFLDLVMPNTNGYELCTFLRKTTAFQHTPIVILTGNDGVIDRVRAKLVGATEFMSKPPIPEKVIQVVEKHAPSSELLS